jgi:co-chaperonin GroES (HSP10)
MRKLIPIKNSVVCKRVNDNTTMSSIGGIQCMVNNVDLYRIIDFNCSDKDLFNFEIGDIIMSNSTGDEIEINNSEFVYLFKIENIMCKVLDQ